MRWQSINAKVVGTARTGSDLVAVVEQESPDLIVSDIRMPGMTGLEAVETIRASDVRVRVVLLTGYQDFDAAYRAIQLDVSGFVLKPIDPSELLKTAWHALSESRELSRRAGEKAKADHLRRIVRDMLHGRPTTESEQLLVRLHVLRGHSGYTVCVSRTETALGNQVLGVGLGVVYAALVPPSEMDRKEDVVTSNLYQRLDEADKAYQEAIEALYEREGTSAKDRCDDLVALCALLLPPASQDDRQLVWSRLSEAGWDDQDSGDRAALARGISLAWLAAVYQSGAIVSEFDVLPIHDDKPPDLVQLRWYIEETLVPRSKDPPYALDTRASERGHRILERLSAIPARLLHLDQIASALSVTPSYASRLVRRETSIRIMDYINYRRAVAAIQMAFETDQSTRKAVEWCRSLGISDVRHLNRLLVKRFGMGFRALVTAAGTVRRWKS